VPSAKATFTSLVSLTTCSLVIMYPLLL
jgi:hypothetical protein